MKQIFVALKNCHYIFFSDESIDFNIPVNKFELSKSYKLVIYYGPLDLLFSKEFLVKVSIEIC